MKRLLFLLIFILAAAGWALIVLTKTIGIGWEPFKAIGLAVFGAFWIGAIGLRLFYLIGPPLPKIKPLPIVNGNNVLESYQMGHREPYFDARAR